MNYESKRWTGVPKDLGNKSLGKNLIGLDEADRIEDIVVSLAAYPKFGPSPCNGAEYMGDVGELNGSARFFRDVTPKDLDFRYDSSTISPTTYDKINGCRYFHTRFLSLSRTACINLGCTHAARRTNGFILDDGSYQPHQNTILIWKGSAGFVAKKTTTCGFKATRHGVIEMGTELTTHLDQGCWVDLSVVFTQKLAWGVLLGCDGRKVRISCDPTSIREFFKMRDVGPSGRRAALRNWVKGHWRRLSSREENEDAKTWVRQHLRNKLDFSWNGINCMIVVSESDLKLADKLRG